MANAARTIDRIEMAERADAVFCVVRLARPTVERGVGDREALGNAVLLRLRARRREDRAVAIPRRCATGRGTSRSSPACHGRGKAEPSGEIRDSVSVTQSL